jgi:hypothetical protein
MLWSAPSLFAPRHYTNVHVDCKIALLSKETAMYIDFIALMARAFSQK